MLIPFCRASMLNEARTLPTLQLHLPYRKPSGLRNDSREAQKIPQIETIILKRPIWGQVKEKADPQWVCKLFHIRPSASDS